MQHSRPGKPYWPSSLSTILSSTRVSAGNCKVLRDRPSSGVLQASVMSRASFSPSRMGGWRGVALFAPQSTFQPLLDKPFPDV